MMRTTQRVEQTQKNKRNVIYTFVSAPIVIMGVLIASWFFSLILEIFGMTFIWPEQGSQHSKSMLVAEMGYMNNGVQRSLYDTTPQQLANGAIAWVNDTLETTGIYPLIRRLATPSQQGDTAFINNLRSLYIGVHDYVMACINITKVFCVRVIAIGLSLPIFLLFGAGAVVDGLVERDLRKFGGGNESAWLYHKVKRYLLTVIIIALVSYLSLPVSVHPNLIFIPAAILFGLMLFITVSRFKKYI